MAALSAALVAAPAHATENPQTPEQPPQEAVEVAPLDKIGDAFWHDGVGFVRPDDEPWQPNDPDEEADRVPDIDEVSLNRFRASVGAGVSYFQPRGTEFFGTVLVGSLGYEFRESTSLVAPWLQGDLSVGSTFPDGAAPQSDSAINAGAMGYFGIDFHPVRYRFIAVGPYVGAGPRIFANDVEAFDYRIDWLGTRVRFRTLDETVDVLPLLEVDVKVFMRASSAELLAPHLGMQTTIGDDLRFMAFVDARLTEPDKALLAEAVSERVRAGLGATWF